MFEISEGQFIPLDIEITNIHLSSTGSYLLVDYIDSRNKEHRAGVFEENGQNPKESFERVKRTFLQNVVETNPPAIEDWLLAAAGELAHGKRIPRRIY